MFIWNLVRSWRRGAPAGPNPWGGDSLEWATPSPPAQHSWSVLPIVRSRHPLWDQDSLEDGDPHLQRFVRGLSQWPLRWRAAAIVGTGDGRPQEVFRVAGPSLWPLITAGGVVLIFLSELVKLRWGAAVGAATIVIGVIGWNWPVEPPMSIDEEDAFEREHGVAVNAGGSVVVAAWGMGIAMLFLSIAFASLVLSYFYLRLENPVWPPPGVAEPGLLRPAAAALLVLAGAAAMRGVPRRGARAARVLDRRARTRTGGVTATGRPGGPAPAARGAPACSGTPSQSTPSTSSRPHDTTETISAPRNVLQKNPSLISPRSSESAIAITIHSTTALITSRNNPSVRTIAGSDSSVMIGRTITLTTPMIRAIPRNDQIDDDAHVLPLPARTATAGRCERPHASC